MTAWQAVGTRRDRDGRSNRRVHVGGQSRWCWRRGLCCPRACGLATFLHSALPSRPTLRETLSLHVNSSFATEQAGFGVEAIDPQRCVGFGLLLRLTDENGGAGRLRFGVPCRPRDPVPPSRLAVNLVGGFHVDPAIGTQALGGLRSASVILPVGGLMRKRGRVWSETQMAGAWRGGRP